MAVASLFEDLLDQYKIEQRIAEKRYTDLYQAYDVDDDRLVRLDVLRAGAADDSGFVARFVNRARAVAQVRHPNIAPIYHIGKTADGLPYVAQAYIDGLPLSQRLEQLAKRNAPVNPLYALKLVRQLADALILAERLELFHYDLQPDHVLLKNVALPTDDSLVLLDLFIPPERHLNGQVAVHDPQTPTSMAYLSPEQRSGREITAPSHVYSLGVLLFRLLAGQLPAGPVTWRDTLLRRSGARNTALERLRPELSPQTFELVDRCLRQEPGRRYGSVEEFLFALDEVLLVEESRVGMSGARTVPRRRLGWLLPILILLLVAAASIAAVRGSRNLAPEATALAAAPLAVTATTAPLSPTAPPTAQPSASFDSPSGAIVAGSTATAAPATATNEPTTTPTATPSPTPSPVPSPIGSETSEPALGPVVQIVLNQVNLRRGPGLAYPLTGSVRAGDLLHVLAWNNDARNPWYLVSTVDQRLGWISAEVVQPDDELAVAAVPVAATIPATPYPTQTPVPTPTTTPTTVMVFPTKDIGGGDNPGGGDPEPTEAPTEAPTGEPPLEPTLTPPPLP